MPEREKGKNSGAAADEPREAREPAGGEEVAVGQEESLKVHGDKYEGLIPGAPRKPTEK